MVARGGSAVDLVYRIGVLGQRREAPNLAIAQVNHDFAVDLAAAVRGAQHCNARFDVEGVDLGVSANGRWSENGTQHNAAQENGNGE
jgi:hypothetical protein